jgi:hypothetical protein
MWAGHLTLDESQRALSSATWLLLLAWKIGGPLSLSWSSAIVPPNTGWSRGRNSRKEAVESEKEQPELKSTASILTCITAVSGTRQKMLCGLP